MRTATHSEDRSRSVHQALWACALAALTAACAAPHARELAELQRDHELCLANDDPWIEVSYADYQACMNRRGWSDADLPHSG
jgi:hypothetical protein